MRHAINLSLLLAAFWLANSGHYSGLLLGLGALSIVLVVYISHRMDALDEQAQSLHWTLRMPGYWLWLCGQIVRSNLDVVRRIWIGKTAISPVMLTVRAGQKTDIGRVIYANSITLTPGTVAVDLVGDAVVVHALTREAAADLESGEMGRRVERLED
jgi:multicomponent Na+:H+ antiporter subunit E